MFRWLTRAALGAALALALGCGKEAVDEPAAPPAAKAPAAQALPPAPAGARRVAVEVKRMGYVPARIDAKAGEDLVLVFTRTEDGSCGQFVEVKGTELKAELPLNQPVELPIKMPATGEVVFACGMDMMHGIVSVSGA